MQHEARSNTTKTLSVAIFGRILSLKTVPLSLGVQRKKHITCHHPNPNHRIVDLFRPSMGMMMMHARRGARASENIGVHLEKF